MSLRRVLTLATLVAAILATVAAGALIVTTTVLQRMTSNLASGVETVRLVEEAEVNLLLHARAKDGVMQRSLESELRSVLEAAGGHVTTAEELRVLREAVERVDDYLRTATDASIPRAELAGHEARAFAALEALVEITVASARGAQAEAIAWDRLANILGVALGIAILAITATLALWLRKRMIAPLLALADAVKQFGQGERVVRAREDGPNELREMSRRFNEMADAIAAQRQAQTAFLGGVAHDIRNPVGALKLACELVSPDRPLPAEPELRWTIGLITRQIDHLDRMLGDFLDMAMIEAGALELRLEQCDARAIVRDSIDLFGSASGHRFDVKLPPLAAVLTCDGARIGQALTNLVSNAIKYSPAEAPIEIVLEVRGSEVVFAVSDHGVGIPRDDHRRIFEPFRRGAPKHSVPGAGLGLFNVQRIVKAHGGRIEVESEPSRGSTFRIWLPATPPAVRRSAPEPHVPGAS